MGILRRLSIAAAVFFGLSAATDLAIRATFPHTERFSSNFSAAYLRREVASVAHDQEAVVFLGDSALWGYKVPPSATAVALLRRQGCECRNLSFEGGSPANTYALLSVLIAAGGHPKTLIFNVNQKEFNPADSAYQKLHPALEALAWPLLGRDERAMLTPSPEPDFNGKVDRALSERWMLYGLRSDLREMLFGDVDAVHALQTALESATGARARKEADHRATAERFEGTYDLSALTGSRDNVSLVFLRKIGELVRARHIRAYALLTPTNHTLLHDYIDVPEYDKNVSYSASILRYFGVEVIDGNRAITASLFIDNDHLTVAGNRRLASLLSRTIFPH